MKREQLGEPEEEAQREKRPHTFFEITMGLPPVPDEDLEREQIGEPAEKAPRETRSHTLLETTSELPPVPDEDELL